MPEVSQHPVQFRLHCLADLHPWFGLTDFHHLDLWTLQCLWHVKLDCWGLADLGLTRNRD